MGKKYLLKINYSEITEDNIEIAARLKESGWDGQTCTSDNRFHFDFETDGGTTINWDLTEIKEPLSFEEWFKNEELKEGLDLDVKQDRRFKLWSHDAWNGCLENQKLSQVVDEDEDRTAMKLFLLNHESSLPASTDEIWNAALKYARGL